MIAHSSARHVTTRGEIWRLLRSWRTQIAIIIVSILAAETLAVIPPLLLRRILDDHLATGVAQGILLLAILYLVATMASEGMHFAVTYSTAYVAQHVLRDLRVRLFAHLQRLPLSFYDRTPLGDIISRCTADVDTVNTLFSSGVANLVLRLAQVAAAFAAMMALSFRLSLLSLLLIPPLALITRFFQVHIRQAERRRRQAIGMLNVHVQETLSGIEVVRAFGREAAFTRRFRQALQEAVAAFWGSESYNMFYTPILTVLVAAYSVLFLWVGAGGAGTVWGLSIGTITIGTITAFILLFQRFFEPIRNLGRDWQTVQSALSGIERIVQVLQIPADMPPQSAATPQDSEPDVLVSLQQIVFGYQSERPVIDHVSITVRVGEHLALVGRTGAGKSSLIHLMGGLYTPWSGQALIAGHDPSRLTDDERRRVVGVVPQMVQLFSGTVWDNLTLGDATVSQKAVTRAAQITGVEQFVSALPNGYQTVIGGAGRGIGVRFSEGQQQLLSLARALVWDPAVLLLDEATASIDHASEAAFRTALRAALQTNDESRRAVITVAHRLSTAREADRIVLLDDGRIVEQGTPDDLLRLGGTFAAMMELEEAGWDWHEKVK